MRTANSTIVYCHLSRWRFYIQRIPTILFDSVSMLEKWPKIKDIFCLAVLWCNNRVHCAEDTQISLHCATSFSCSLVHLSLSFPQFVARWFSSRVKLWTCCQFHNVIHLNVLPFCFGWFIFFLFIWCFSWSILHFYGIYCIFDSFSCCIIFLDHFLSQFVVLTTCLLIVAFFFHSVFCHHCAIIVSRHHIMLPHSRVTLDSQPWYNPRLLFWCLCSTLSEQFIFCVFSYSIIIDHRIISCIRTFSIFT